MSWGTKGSDAAPALPQVSSKKPKGDESGAVVEDTVQEKADLDASFKETVARAVTKVKVVEVEEKPTMDVSCLNCATICQTFPSNPSS